jgi:hypothetical protein
MECIRPIEDESQAMPIVTRLYHDPKDAAATISELKAAGITDEEISLVAGHGESNLPDPEHPDVTQTALDAEAGEAVGAVLGGLAGLLAGLGVLAIPGIGLVVAAGWLVATITGAGVGAAAGGLVGALVGAGIPEENAEEHIAHIKRGSVLLTVRADAEKAVVAEEIMDSRDR